MLAGAWEVAQTDSGRQDWATMAPVVLQFVFISSRKQIQNAHLYSQLPSKTFFKDMTASTNTRINTWVFQFNAVLLPGNIAVPPRNGISRSVYAWSCGTEDKGK